jgi:hypothetical protein
MVLKTSSTRCATLIVNELFKTCLHVVVGMPANVANAVKQIYKIIEKATAELPRMDREPHGLDFLKQVPTPMRTLRRSGISSEQVVHPRSVSSTG